MLARLLACLNSKWYNTQRTWEHYLPVKYRDAALYSVVTDQTTEEVRALSQQMGAFAQTVQGMLSDQS